MPRARLCLLALAAPLAAGAAQPAETVSWYLIADDDGAVLGHATREGAGQPDSREIIETRTLYLTEQDQHPARIIERTVTRLDATGRPVAITSIAQHGRNTTRTETRIVASAATVARQTSGSRHVQHIPLPPGTRFDNGEGLLAGWDRKAPLDFASFNPAAMTVERTTIELAPAQRPGAVTVLRKRYEDGQLRGIVRLDLDARGQVAAVMQPMFGTAIVTRPTDRETALRERPPYRVLRNVMHKSPFRIAPGAASGQIRYRFGFRDGITFVPPATPEQRVQTEGEDATLDICTQCGPGLPADPASLADARRATAWLQRDHPRIQAMAAPVAKLDISDARKMALLAARAKRVMTRVDFTGHFSAVDALARGAGDCTEDAAILAALGRAAGIPTKVASGLVYSRERYHGVSNVFMPHSWTLAYVDGAWRSFDMSLDGFDATHIALTIGNGDARSITAAGQLASLLEWQSIAEVRKRASP
ncbi:transglutaminase-like domain-containing protein [Sphingomonas koreensis]